MNLRESLRMYLRNTLTGFNSKAAVILLSSGALLLLHHNHFRRRFFTAYFGHMPWTSSGRFAQLYSFFYWESGTLLLLALIPFLIGYFLIGMKPKEMGISRPDFSKGGAKIFGAFLAVMIVVVIAASYFKEFSGYYPEGKFAATSLVAYLIYEMGYLVYFISWEFFFRGYMLFGLEPHLGRGNAAIISTVIFAIMHFNKPEIEALGALAAGLALAMLAFSTRSFLSCAALHWMVAMSMNIAAIIQKSAK